MMSDIERETRYYIADDEGDIWTPDKKLIDQGTYNHQFAFNRDLVTFTSHDEAQRVKNELETKGLEYLRIEEIHPTVKKED